MTGAIAEYMTFNKASSCASLGLSVVVVSRSVPHQCVQVSFPVLSWLVRRTSMSALWSSVTASKPGADLSLSIGLSLALPPAPQASPEYQVNHGPRFCTRTENNYEFLLRAWGRHPNVRVPFVESLFLTGSNTGADEPTVTLPRVGPQPGRLDFRQVGRDEATRAVNVSQHLAVVASDVLLDSEHSEHSSSIGQTPNHHSSDSKSPDMLKRRLLKGITDISWTTVAQPGAMHAVLGSATSACVDPASSCRQRVRCPSLPIDHPGLFQKQFSINAFS